jgi:hypothetical protein
MKLCVIITKENKMHIEKENISVLAKVTQVIDVAHGSLVPDRTQILQKVYSKFCFRIHYFGQ